MSDVGETLFAGKFEGSPCRIYTCRLDELPNYSPDAPFSSENASAPVLAWRLSTPDGDYGQHYMLNSPIDWTTENDGLISTCKTAMRGTIKNLEPVGIDHSMLLRKYIHLVMECEGVHFIPSHPDDEFSAEEIAELRRLARMELGDVPEGDRRKL